MIVAKRHFVVSNSRFCTRRLRHLTAGAPRLSEMSTQSFRFWIPAEVARIPASQNPRGKFVESISDIRTLRRLHCCDIVPDIAVPGPGHERHNAIMHCTVSSYSAMGS